MLAAFAGVVMQAFIGGARVSFPAYKALIAVPHALVAQSFFALIVVLVVITSAKWLEDKPLKQDSSHPPARRLVILTVCAVLAQTALGAGFRHGAFGVVPHVAGAAVVSLLIIWTTLTIVHYHGRDAYLRRPALAVLTLLSCQLILGILAYGARLSSYNDPQPLEPMITLTVAHVVVGALTLASLVVLALSCWRALTPARERDLLDKLSLQNSSTAVV